MKTKEHEIIFNKEDVQQIVQLIGDRNPIYQSSERAQDYGFETILLPPTMPMMAYKWPAPPMGAATSYYSSKTEMYPAENVY